jgi:hypothetical protein
MNKTTADKISISANCSLYRDLSADAKRQAQQNLEGRTYYASDETLKYHHSRILDAEPIMSGLFFKIVESAALDMNNTQRGCRVVVFDLWGRTAHHPSLSDCVATKAAAIKLFEKEFSIDAAGYYRDELIRRAERMKKEAALMIEAAEQLEEVTA